MLNSTIVNEMKELLIFQLQQKSMEILQSKYDVVCASRQMGRNNFFHLMMIDDAGIIKMLKVEIRELRNIEDNASPKDIDDLLEAKKIHDGQYRLGEKE